MVATMWLIGDKLAPEVAESFYRHMIVSEESNGGIGGDRAAVALYEAVKEF